MIYTFLYNIFVYTYCLESKVTDYIDNRDECIKPMSAPHSSLEIITTKEVTTKKKNLICQMQAFQAEIHLLNLLKLHLDCSSHQMQFGSDLPKFYYICKFTSHCCFFLPAKAFKISQSRYPESVWQSATGHVTEGE